MEPSSLAVVTVQVCDQQQKIKSERTFKEPASMDVDAGGSLYDAYIRDRSGMPCMTEEVVICALTSSSCSLLDGNWSRRLEMVGAQVYRTSSSVDDHHRLAVLRIRCRV